MRQGKRTKTSASLDISQRLHHTRFLRLNARQHLDSIVLGADLVILRILRTRRSLFSFLLAHVVDVFKQVAQKLGTSLSCFRLAQDSAQ